MKKAGVFLWVLLMLVPACRNRTSSHAVHPADTLSGGWEILFNGKDLSHWQALGLDSIPSVWWRVEEGTIHKVARNKVQPYPGGSLPPTCDLMTNDTYYDFELEFEWKIAPGSNSGIKYNVSEKMSKQYSGTHALGFEYQIIDDTGYPGPLSPLQHTAALYALVPPQEAEPQPAGEWNYGRILLRGNHGEHWLNGKKVLEYEMGTPRFDSLVAVSKYHKYPGFARHRSGHIVLQDHADDVWFRNLKIRRLQDHL